MAEKFVFKNSFKQQLLVLLPFIIMNGGIFYGMKLILGQQDITGNLFWLYVFVVLFFVLPVILLHVQYLVITFHTMIIFQKDKKTIELFRRQGKAQYSFLEILKVDYFATSGHISRKGSTLYYPFDPYRYYKITFKDGQRVYVTCLMGNNIENRLGDILGADAERHFRILPFIY